MTDERDDDVREGNRLMLSGAGLGLVSAASTVVLGATCPLCVVGAPALVAWGAYKRWYPARRDEEGETSPRTDRPES